MPFTGTSQPTLANHDQRPSNDEELAMYGMILRMAAAGLMLSIGGRALAADKAPVQSVERTLLENERVRVVEVSFKPGAVDEMKDRSPRVVYYFTDAHFTVTGRDGKVMQRDTKAGSAAWRVQETNEVANTGKEDVRLTVTYLK